MSPSSPSTSWAPTTSIKIRFPPKARPTPPGGSTPRTVKVSMPRGVRRGSFAPTVTPSRAHVGHDHAPRVDQEAERVVDHVLARLDQVERPDRVPVGDVGGEHRER